MKALLNAVSLVVVASVITVSAAKGAPLPEGTMTGAANALNRLSEMKIRHAILEESLQNVQIEARIAAVEKKMNGTARGASSKRIPVVSLLTCSGTTHCSATLSLPDGARVSAYPGTVIGSGLTVVGVTAHGVLAASGSNRFYLPFSGGASGSAGAGKSVVGSRRSASALPPPVFGGEANASTPPAGMMPPAGMQSPSNFSGGMQ